MRNDGRLSRGRLPRVVPHLVFEKPTSGRFSDLAALDTGGADLHALRAALRTLNADGLQVGLETAARSIVGVRDIITELRPFAADFASFSHVNENLRTLKKRVPVSFDVLHSSDGDARLKTNFITNSFTSRQAVAIGLAGVVAVLTSHSVIIF